MAELETDADRKRVLDAAVAMFERQHALDLDPVLSIRAIPAVLDRMLLEEVRREHARLRRWWTEEKTPGFMVGGRFRNRAFVCRICGGRRKTANPIVLAGEHAWFHLREILRRELERE